MTARPEERESLWLLIAAPAIWSAHFLLSYISAAIWCAKVAGPGGALGGVRLAIAAYTVVALGGIGVTGWSGLRRYRRGAGAVPFDADTPDSRHRFLGFATALLAALAAVATVFAAMAALFVEDCR